MTSVLSSREYADLRCKVACGLGQAGVPLNHQAVARVGGAGVALPCPTAGASMIIRDFAAEGRGWCDSRARCACRDVRPRGAFVVVGPTTTLFRRRWANHDIPIAAGRAFGLAQLSPEGRSPGWEDRGAVFRSATPSSTGSTSMIVKDFPDPSGESFRIMNGRAAGRGARAVARFLMIMRGGRSLIRPSVSERCFGSTQPLAEG